KYPDPEAKELVEALAKAYDVDKEKVFVGVGSDDVLAMSFLTFFAGERPILFPDITYSFYPVWCELFGIPYETVPLDASFQIRPENYQRENGGIVIANPNAPTGIALPRAKVEDIVKENPDSVCIVDEAYIDFGGESMLPLIDDYDNLLVVRTFSKSRALAGSRIGYAFANPRLMKYLNDVKFSFNSYTMDSVTQAIGVASVEDKAYFNKTVDRIVATREKTRQALSDLGFSVLPSQTNFLFARHPKRSAAELFARLKEKGIYVRYFASDRIDEYLRISIGMEDQMDTLCKALSEEV
ncbi:MAG: histidinol-phosphate transaminase, partial [Lachnospiraceae bacterium]|nr:histidinol-phosphate transaminase [Lachnospiraceae bacterium]